MKGQVQFSAVKFLRMFRLSWNFINNDPYDILSIYVIFWNSFETIEGSNVKFKDAPIELKINGNDPFNLVSMLKIFENWFKSIKGVQLCVCSHFSGYTTNLFTCRLTYLAPFARAQFLVSFFLLLKLGGMPPNLLGSWRFFFFLLSFFLSHNLLLLPHAWLDFYQTWSEAFMGRWLQNLWV